MCQPFKRVNPQKAPCLVPWHSTQACVDQLDIFKLSLLHPRPISPLHCRTPWSLQFAVLLPAKHVYREHPRSLYCPLPHQRNTYVCMLSIDYSLVFNTIVPSKAIIKLRDLGSTQPCVAGSWTSWQAVAGCGDGHHLLFHTDSQH